MSEFERPEDRTTAAERVPITTRRRHEFADGVYIGYGDSEIHLPPRPRRPSGFELAKAHQAAIREDRERTTRRRWAMAFKALGWLALVLGALIMVAVTHG